MHADKEARPNIFPIPEPYFLVLCCSETSIDGFWAFKIVKVFQSGEEEEEDAFRTIRMWTDTLEIEVARHPKPDETSHKFLRHQNPWIGDFFCSSGAWQHLGTTEGLFLWTP